MNCDPPTLNTHFGYGQGALYASSLSKGAIGYGLCIKPKAIQEANENHKIVSHLSTITKCSAAQFAILQQLPPCSCA